MKKAQLYRRLGSLWTNLREYFVEEEPRDKARRAMKEATHTLNRIIFQRTALQHECDSGSLDEESLNWCEQNLRHLKASESLMTEQLAVMREEYRKLMLQDLFYNTLRDPGDDCLEAVQVALLELQASVESERTVRSLPRMLEGPPSSQIEGETAEVETSVIVDSLEQSSIKHEADEASRQRPRPSEETRGELS